MKVQIPAGIAFGMSTKQAVNFQYALQDIGKVNPHVNIEKAKKELFALSKQTPGKSLTDLAQAYKLAAQTMRPEEIEKFLAIIEKSSIAFDLSATETAHALTIIKNNLKYTNEELDQFGDKAAYAHHQFGVATVDNILQVQGSLSDLSKQMGINQEAITACSTTLLNAGRAASAKQSTIETMARRLSLDEAWESRKQYQQAMSDLGMDSHEMAKMMTQDPTKGISTFLNKLNEAKAKGKNTTSLAYFLVGANYQSEVQLLSDKMKEATKLQKELTGEIRKADGCYVYAGESARAYNSIMNTTKKRLENLKNSLQRSSEELGEGFLNLMSKEADILSKMLETFSEAPPWIHKTAGALLFLGVALGPVASDLSMILKIMKSMAGMKELSWLLNFIPGGALTKLGVGLGVAGVVGPYNYFKRDKKSKVKDETQQGLGQDWMSSMNSSYFAPQQAQSNAQMTKIPNQSLTNGDFVVNINSSNLAEDELKIAITKVYQENRFEKC